MRTRTMSGPVPAWVTMTIYTRFRRYVSFSQLRIVTSRLTLKLCMVDGITRVELDDDVCLEHCSEEIERNKVYAGVHVRLALIEQKTL